MENLKDKKLLVLVESPNKVKKVSEYIKKAGYTATVMATLGHTTEIADDSKSYKNTGIYPEKQFSTNVQIAKDKYKTVSSIQAAARGVDIVIIASDPDREGENLGNHIKDLLKLKENQYYRISYHSITPEAIKDALENPRKMDYDLIAAADARQILDKLVGYSMSPIAKTYVGAKSVGRCQSPALKLIVDREKEIEDFKPEQYFDLYLNFTKNNTAFKAKYAGTEQEPVEHLKTKEEVEFIKYKCSGNQFVVKNIKSIDKHDKPRPPFCTSTFQQEVSSKLGLGVKDAMSICQQIFEGGFVTYHRTDDQELSEEFIPVLKSYIEKTFGKANYVEPRKGKKQENAQQGHEGLRVTDPNLTPEEFNKKDPNNLHQKVYKIIWQRTIASALPDAIIAETTYSIYNQDQIFNLVSKELKVPGYKVVYNYKDEDEAEDEIVKETFVQNEVLNNTNLDAAMKQTTPPARYTEAMLVKALEKEAIGRPSTFATIVDTILSSTRGYATLENKRIVPTEKGIQLTNFLDRSFSNIININYTKEMEESLDKIAAGKLDKLAFLTEFFNNLETTIKNNTEGTESKEEKICPECGAPMVVRRSRYGKLFYGCSTYPKCHGILNIK